MQTLQIAGHSIAVNPELMLISIFDTTASVSVRSSEKPRPLPELQAIASLIRSLQARGIRHQTYDCHHNGEYVTDSVKIWLS